MSIAKIRQWGIRLLTQASPEFPVPVGSCLSLLDVKSSMVSTEATERLWAENPPSGPLLKAINHFIGGNLGELMLKKGLNLALENRMRFLAWEETPASDFQANGLKVSCQEHALDKEAARFLGVREHKPGLGSKLNLAFSAWLQIMVFGLYLLWELRRGSWGIKKQEFRVLSGNVGNAGIWGAVSEEIKQAGLWGEDAIAFIDEFPGQGYNPGNSFKLYSINTLRIDIRRHLFSALPSGLWLFFVMIISLIRNIFNPVKVDTLREAAFQARQAIRIMRITDNFKFNFYLDTAEYTATHIVKSMVMEKAKAKLTRWPHCMMWNPGGFVSYLGYALYFSSGYFEKIHYSNSWRQDMEYAGVGLLFRSPLLKGEGRVRPDYAQKIEQKIKAGGKILAWFGPSPVQGVEEIAKITLKASVDAVIAKKEWFLVVKFKGYNSFRYHWPLCQNIPGIEELEKEGRILVVDYSKPGEETCAAVWLIEKMELGIGMGSVQIEAASAGKPILSYMPIPLLGELHDYLLNNQLDFSQPDKFRQGLISWMDKNREEKLDVDWFCHNFDLFGDENALKRIVAKLWSSK